MKTIFAKNAVATMYGVKWAYVVDEKVLLVSYESSGLGSMWDQPQKVRLEFDTKEEMAKAFHELRAFMGEKAEVLQPTEGLNAKD